jgi:DMSO reductase anchor subunit
MRPAWSVIFFTSLSGVGYGLTFWLGLVCLLEPPASPWPLVINLGIAGFLITVGLLSSTLHLHHPERAWRAISQWRSSWLSREGVAAIATYGPLVWLGWSLWQGDVNGVAALLLTLMSVVTVFCTAMIYSSLQTVRAWCHGWVPPIYLGFALVSGGYWLLAVGAPAKPGWLPVASVLILAAVWWGKWRYWRDLDHGIGDSTPATATGLPGSVQLLDPPHTEDNYLLKEMAYQVARRHSDKLRRMALVFGLFVPLLCLVGLFVPAWAAAVLLGLGAVSLTGGIFIERWLFFAEATHAVTLYYGGARA